VDAKNEKEYHSIYFKLINEMFEKVPNQGVIALVMKISQKIIEGEHYQALKICKKLLNFELELLANVTG
jgi:flagellar protein FlbT